MRIWRARIGCGTLGIFILLPAVSWSQDSTPTPIDWANPPVSCVEELVPQQVPCLDLSAVTNPLLDFPPDLDEAGIRYWTVDHPADLSVCRAQEIQRRERSHPGSQNPSVIAWAWMWVKQVEHLELKIAAIYDAAELAEMPPQILFGALKQESLLADLGISDDGGNFSCGIGQINLIEWCHFMETRSEPDQRLLGWPTGISCSAETLPTNLVRPFHKVALERLGGRPEYELTPLDFEQIALTDVQASFPPGDPGLQARRFQAVTSFVQKCSDVALGIAAKGRELRRLYDLHVPPAMKAAQTYAPGQTFLRPCRRAYRSPKFPLHTGWLLADAIYNAGSREISLLQYYFRMNRKSHESGKIWRRLTPLDLIEALHWGGKYRSSSGQIEYRSVYGTPSAQTWFKSCVVQRHIARVVQHSTLPGAVIARSLEAGGCSRTEIPDHRRRSSGKISMRDRPR